MNPIRAALVVAGLHFALTLAVIVIGTGPLFSRRDAGLPATRYDRCLAAVMKALMSPVHPITDRFPGLIGGTGWPREHLLLAANSALWGIAAGAVIRLIGWPAGPGPHAACPGCVKPRPGRPQAPPLARLELPRAGSPWLERALCAVAPLDEPFTLFYFERAL